MNMKNIAIYDTTLRDGAQAEGVSFSAVAKVQVAKRLDEFGIAYIEGGFAASNPKDMEFFRLIKKETLKNAKIAAFGSTRRANTAPEDDNASSRAIVLGQGQGGAQHLRPFLQLIAPGHTIIDAQIEIVPVLFAIVPQIGLHFRDPSLETR